MNGLQIAEILDEELAPLSLLERAELISKHFSAPVFTTSLGIEDQVLTWGLTAGLSQERKNIRFATLQTGRLFPETLELIDTTDAAFNITIERFEPKADGLANYIKTYGANGFYDSLEARKACCGVRKVEPLGRALKGADAWITGLRREQSDNRADVPFAQWDEERQLVKLNPLADWTTEQVHEAVRAHDIPINPLHARNYPSIGCEPCTRAIKPGEPERAGRWWWENDDKQECGLHVPESQPVGDRVNV